MIARLDTVLLEIYLPKSVCALLEDNFGLEWNEAFGIYMVSDEQRNRLRKENTSVSFESTSTSDSSTVVRIELPDLAFDHEVKFPPANISDKETTLHYFPLKRTPNETTTFPAFLGRTFF